MMMRKSTAAISDPTQDVVLNDKYLARYRFADRPAYLRRLITIFKASYHQKLLWLEQAIAVDDNQNYAQLLHDLRAAARNMGVVRLEHVCVQAEIVTDRVSRQHSLADIRQAFQQAVDALTEYARSINGQV